MKRLLNIILCVTLALGAWAENIVTGKVVDKASGDVIDFANVSITKQGSTTPIDGTVTDATDSCKISCH